MLGPEGRLVHFVTIQTASPVIGQTMEAGGIVLDARNVDGSQIATMVQQAVETLRAERTKALGAELGAPPTKLVLPD